jgi:hypothetical protein
VLSVETAKKRVVEATITCAEVHFVDRKRLAVFEDSLIFGPAEPTPSELPQPSAECTQRTGRSQMAVYRILADVVAQAIRSSGAYRWICQYAWRKVFCDL